MQVLFLERMRPGPRKRARKGRCAVTQKRANAAKRRRLQEQWRKGGAEGPCVSLGLKQKTTVELFRTAAARIAARLRSLLPSCVRPHVA